LQHPKGCQTFFNIPFPPLSTNTGLILILTTDRSSIIGTTEFILNEMLALFWDSTC